MGKSNFLTLSENRRVFLKLIIQVHLVLFFTTSILISIYFNLGGDLKSFIGGLSANLIILLFITYPFVIFLTHLYESFKNNRREIFKYMAQERTIKVFPDYDKVGSETHKYYSRRFTKPSL